VVVRSRSKSGQTNHFQRVIRELSGSKTDRVQAALNDGWAEIIDAPSPTDGDAIAASDIAARTIANETGKPEHEVEKIDAILAGLAIQYLDSHE